MRLEFSILFMTATLCGPGGVRAVIAEHLLLEQQLLVLHRPRQRALPLTASDRRLFGFGSLFLSPGRIRKIAICVRPPRLRRRTIRLPGAPRRIGPRGIRRPDGRGACACRGREATSSPASSSSRSWMMLSRSKMARLVCQVRSMATRSGTPARVRVRAAVRRQSWRKWVGTPAA